MKRRVLLAPVEIAGVGSATRDALRRRGHQADLWAILPHPFQSSEDRLIQGYPARTQAALQAVRDYDVLHFQAGNTFAEYLDVAWARMGGRRGPVVLMHYWGDDVRLRLEADYIPIGAGPEWFAQQRANERLIRRRLRLASRLCHAAVVSDLELARHACRWFSTVYVVPTPLEVAPLPVAAAARENGGALRVVHAPSHALKKGTDTVLAAVERLRARTPVDLRLLKGVPRAEVWAEIAAADVVIDQLGSQTTGVLTLESMAIGRPVLVQYDRQLLAPFARDTPAVCVTPETIDLTLAQLAADATLRHRLGDQGRKFVRRVHDSDAVAAAVERIYDDARTAGPGLFEATPDGVRPLAFDAE